MMAGVPIVSTIWGGLPEVLRHNSTALLVPTNDVEAFAEAIVRLSSDDELRDDIIRNAGHVVRHQFSVNSMIEKYASLVKAVIPYQ
jgi:glycosyltransferase involved in cell wall biosynthesis